MIPAVPQWFWVWAGVISLLMGTVWAFRGDYDRAVFHLVWAVFCRLQVDDD